MNDLRDQLLKAGVATEADAKRIDEKAFNEKKSRQQRAKKLESLGVLLKGHPDYGKRRYKNTELWETMMVGNMIASLGKGSISGMMLLADQGDNLVELIKDTKLEESTCLKCNAKGYWKIYILPTVQKHLKEFTDKHGFIFLGINAPLGAQYHKELREKLTREFGNVIFEDGCFRCPTETEKAD